MPTVIMRPPSKTSTLSVLVVFSGGFGGRCLVTSASDAGRPSRLLNVGTSTRRPHFGHFSFSPARLSGTSVCSPHERQVIVIILFPFDLRLLPTRRHSKTDLLYAQLTSLTAGRGCPASHGSYASFHEVKEAVYCRAFFCCLALSAAAALRRAKCGFFLICATVFVFNRAAPLVLIRPR